MRFASNYLVCEGREIRYTEWGAERDEVVIAWHGLARTGRDMDDIAEHLAARYRVICPDTIGRGLSEWSPEPEREYCLAFYGRIAVSLMDQLGIRPSNGLRRTGPRPHVPNVHRQEPEVPAFPVRPGDRYLVRFD
jgi:pimeloyl-ACP methyl ester carboxylesterase